MDPVEKLPPEITSAIFGLLDAPTLLTASLASQTWRARILDSRLWKRLYSDQGWGLEAHEIERFEEVHSRLIRQEFRRAKTHLRPYDMETNQPQHKKRATSGWLGQRERRIFNDMPRWQQQHGVIEADGDVSDTGLFAEHDQDMQDVSSGESQSHATPSRRKKRQSQDSGDEMEVSPINRRALTFDGLLQTGLHPPLRPQLLSDNKSTGARINWAFLYKQRRRLEENWVKGRYTNFQLPHPLHPSEAHEECVYTIQFFGKWLVSGSRDKTLRVWDLETRRLRGPPLTGHTQSVLCLQFDPTEKEDVIISGSSDTGVIIWRFSTGQKTHEIPRAHRESVLNLRFDSRYLVTCSKDRMIKVWNRHELTARDPDYPKINPKSQAKMPSYIVDTSSMSPSVLEARIANRQIKTLQPYTLLMILDGHTAAVNAIQIDKDQIVSASGDRHIKVWNVEDGSLVNTLVGHQKGIACVQFDSRRVVSGSSDNTVRIFDHATAAEVAVLHGHTNLVRTVQAGFGDRPGADEDHLHQARAAERSYAEGVRNGTIVEETRTRRQSQRRGAADLSTQLRAFGASLPPGGGGSQWGRIVSGSYDETIIIWKKDADGRWVVGHCLRQEAAIRTSAAADMRAYNDSRITAGGAPAFTTHSAVTVGLSHSSTLESGQATASASQIVQAAMQTSMAGLRTGIQSVMNIGGSIGTGNAGASSSTSQSGSFPGGLGPTWMAPGAQQAMHQLQSHAHNVMQAAMTQGLQPTSSNPTLSTTQSVVGQQQAAGSFDHHGHPNHHHQHQLQANANNHAAGHSNNGNLQGAAAAAAQQSVSRVFKLQFDARRIICCSQDPRIVGWDFADGDQDIIEASRFFVGP